MQNLTATPQVFRDVDKDRNIIEAKRGDGTVIGTGCMPRPIFGAPIEFDMDGSRFRSFRVLPINDRDQAFDFLRKNAPSITAYRAKALVDEYGLDVFEALRSRGGDVCRVLNVPPALVAKMSGEVQVAYGLSHDYSALAHLCQEGFMKHSAIAAATLKWGYDATKVVKANPYIMIDAIRGVDFKKADRIALSKQVGIAFDDPLRCSEALKHVLKQEEVLGGHAFTRMGDAGNKVMRLTRAPKENILEGADRAVYSEAVVRAGGSFWLKATYDDEWYVARKLEHLKRQDLLECLDPVTDGLHDDQMSAYEGILQHKVAILTGAAGTGKTYVVARAIQTFRDAGLEMTLCAPTGKAAKRMTEHLIAAGLDGVQARTIHSVLQPMKNKAGEFVFQRGGKNPLACDVLVVDEMSMVDDHLMASLLRAVPSCARVLLVGDFHQLPSVGCGRVFWSMIDSGSVACYELTSIKRQNPGLLLTNCHRIREGLLPSARPLIENMPYDMKFVELDDARDIQDYMVDLVTKELPAAGHHPMRDIQVITPRRRHRPPAQYVKGWTQPPLCMESLNPRLQQALNPGEEIVASYFRIGDKVVQKRNDTLLLADSGDEVAVVNGDIGYVTAYDDSSAELEVAFENPYRRVKIPLADSNLELAYALTVHAMQGSEAPVVVIPVHKEHGTMIMQRTLAYTAITRATDLCFVVGQKACFDAAVKSLRSNNRRTDLNAFMVRAESFEEGRLPAYTRRGEKEPAKTAGEQEEHRDGSEDQRAQHRQERQGL